MIQSNPEQVLVGQEFQQTVIQAQLDKVFYRNNQVFNLLKLSDKQFASSGKSSKISIWELDKEDPINQIRIDNCGKWIWALENINENTLAAGGGGDFSFYFINWVTCEIIKIFKGHTSNLRTILQLRQQDQVLSAGEDQSIIIWKHSGEIVKTIQKAHDSSIFCCINVSKNRVLSTGCDHKICLWNDQNWELIQSVTIKDDKYSYYLLLLNDDYFAVSGDNNGKVHIFKIDNLQFKFSIQVFNPKNREYIFKLLKIDDQTFLAAGFNNKSAKIVKWKSQKPLGEKKIKCEGNIYCGMILLSQQKIIIGCSGDQNQINVWI